MLITNSAGPTADVEAIANNITTLFSATDARDWRAVEERFADSVQMDYSDLGAEPATQTPQEIVNGWQAMLPGFERTVHQPHNLAVWVAGKRATATYDALATHYLDGENWTVFAGYDSEFVKRDGVWKLARTRLSLYEQAGNQELIGRALANVENDRLPKARSRYPEPDFTPRGASAHYSVHGAGASPDSGVELRPVSFDSEGDQLKGHLFLPPNFDETATYPAVIVTGSWTSVKEQMPDEYASLLAKDGFVALTFDFRGFGESEGSPRQFEDSERKIEDIRNAAGYLLSHPNTNDDLTGLGVCASSGYMAYAVARDDRFSRLTLVAPWLHNAEMTEVLYASRPGGRAGLLDLSAQAKAAFEADGTVHYDQAVSELNPLAAMYVPGGAFSYYLDPAMAAGPVYENRWAVMSWEPWLTFDAISVASDIDVPVHIVHSESGAVPQGAKEFIELLPTEPTVHWLNDYTQLDLYYQPEAVNAAIGRTSDWLRGRR